MAKIKLTRELDYVQGHLRSGHLELVVLQFPNNLDIGIIGNCIYKVELDKEFNIYDNFIEITQVQDGVYKFITGFYNGSTDLQDMLQKGFDQKRNN